MAPYKNSPIYEWNIRKLTEKESFSPEVSQSVRSLWSGLDGSQSIDVVKEKDPIYIEWTERVVDKSADGRRDTDSGYLLDEGYFDVSAESSEITSRREKVSKIVFHYGSILFFTETKHTFILTMKSLYQLF